MIVKVSINLALLEELASDICLSKFVGKVELA
jgi:hypothetical protein